MIGLYHSFKNNEIICHLTPLGVRLKAISARIKQADTQGWVTPKLSLVSVGNSEYNESIIYQGEAQMKYTTILPLEFRIGDFVTALNTVVVREDYGLILIDCGNAGDLEKLEAAMEKEGLALVDVKKIIITHHDSDHIGALKDIVDKYPQIEVLSSLEQAPYITGKIKPLRLTIAEERYKTVLTAAEKEACQRDITGLSALRTIEKVTVVNDGDILPGSCGIEIIEVSGHMPGHLSVYVRADKTLISGDALTSWDGKLNPPDARFSLDLPCAVKSLEKLLNFEIDKVVCYHGGLVDGSIRESLRDITKKGQ